ncbi:MAG TPA: HTH domain-containing protein, partial [Rhizomicrobium sp.]|nr:HTH domain-containing protein [Rhizomicrobium sp.]
MRRADRLFRIIQILRRKKRPTTANEIADELEISLRTAYRDIAQLMADRVPIRGEAGIGYVLEGGFDMPPLMLTPDEIEAAMLGAQWVMGRADPVLARAAGDLVAKIGVVIPEHLRPLLMEPALAT